MVETNCCSSCAACCCYRRQERQLGKVQAKDNRCIISSRIRIRRRSRHDENTGNKSSSTSSTTSTTTVTSTTIVIAAWISSMFVISLSSSSPSSCCFLLIESFCVVPLVLSWQNLVPAAVPRTQQQRGQKKHKKLWTPVPPLQQPRRRFSYSLSSSLSLTSSSSSTSRSSSSYHVGEQCQEGDSLLKSTEINLKKTRRRWRKRNKATKRIVKETTTTQQAAPIMQRTDDNPTENDDSEGRQIVSSSEEGWTSSQTKEEQSPSLTLVTPMSATSSWNRVKMDTPYEHSKSSTSGTISPSASIEQAGESKESPACPSSRPAAVVVVGDDDFIPTDARQQNQKQQQQQHNPGSGAKSSGSGRGVDKMRIKGTSLRSALCIVPPDDAWDSIQRCRYMANDKTYSSWPPSIRLFHPFIPVDDEDDEDDEDDDYRESDIHDVALQIAQVVEKYNVKPFTVTLDQWSIIPHHEAIEADLRAIYGQDYDEDDDYYGSYHHEDQSQSIKKQYEEDAFFKSPLGNDYDAKRRRQMNELVEQESSACRKKAQARKEKKLMKQRLLMGHDADGNANENANADANDNDNDAGNNDKTEDSSERDWLEKKKSMYEEFNGPCIVCLEPSSLDFDFHDDNSKGAYEDSGEEVRVGRDRLIELRELLRDNLFQDYDHYSTGSSMSMLNQQYQESDHRDAEFRPIVPIASFPTVTSAYETARRLRGLWKPVTFNVTDLQIMSCRSAPIHGGGGRRRGRGPRSGSDSVGASFFGSTIGGSGDGSSSGGIEARFFSTSMDGDGRFGCDALITLMGEEMIPDENVKEIVDFVCRYGQRGGGDPGDSLGGGITNSDPSDSHMGKHWPGAFDLDELVDDEESVEELRRWLYDDEDDLGDHNNKNDHHNSGNVKGDAGAVVVIGRTQLFTGDAREYVGMPATSTTDGKDRFVDEICGVARRRNPVHRSCSMYTEGDYGWKNSDTSPFSLKKRTELRRQRQRGEARQLLENGKKRKKNKTKKRRKEP